MVGKGRALCFEPGKGMSLETAHAIWGAEAVAAALAEPNPAPLDAAELAAWMSRARTLGVGALRAWSGGLPWPSFCRLVRAVSGREFQELLEESESN